MVTRGFSPREGGGDGEFLESKKKKNPDYKAGRCLCKYSFWKNYITFLCINFLGHKMLGLKAHSF